MASIPDGSAPPVRVFVSYSHDSPGHATRVLTLADQLRQSGIDARIDQYESHPEEGWPRWMQRQIEEATFILLVCTETFCRRFEGKESPGKGWGATWEGSLVTIDLYQHATRNTRFLPVLFDGEPEDAVPLCLRAYTWHRVPSGWEGLYRRLTGQPAVVAPPLGAVKAMPPRTGPAAFPATRPEDQPRPGGLAQAQASEDELVTALLACKAVQDPARRALVLDRLNPELRSRISDNPAVFVHVTNIVKTCASYPGGLTQLCHAVAYVEGPSHSMRVMNVLVKEMLEARSQGS